MRKFLALAIPILSLGAFFAPAQAATQTIDATLSTSVAMTTSPTSAISWTLAASGANTNSGGNMVISANAPYTVTVSAAKAALTEWNGTGYVTGGKSLSSPLTVSPTRTGGTAPVPGVAVPAVTGTTALALATGTGLGTDQYSLTLAQPTTIADSALSGSNTYHNVLTYTASATL